MNVYEFLGMTPRNSAVQLVKHYNEVPESKRQAYPYCIQRKVDGVFGMLVVPETGPARVFGRSGKSLTSCEALSNNAKQDNLKPGVYIGEVSSDSEHSLEELSGCVNPNRVKPLEGRQALIVDGLTFYAHDHLTIHEFMVGYSATRYSIRHHCLADLVSGCQWLRVLPYEWAHSEEDIEAFYNATVGEGEEGIVIKAEMGWVAGHKGYISMKLVRSISYDLLCIGKEEGKGKRSGMVSNLLFKWRGGDTIKADLGLGWSDKDRIAAHTCPEHDPVGNIYKVYALQESSKGKLRLPKVGELRIDKETPDVT